MSFVKYAFLAMHLMHHVDVIFTVMVKENTRTLNFYLLFQEAECYEMLTLHHLHDDVVLLI